MSNPPLSNFSAAGKGNSNANVKLSSAELLSMLKKPTTTGSSNISTSNPIIHNSTGALNSPTNYSESPVKSIIHPFKEDDYTLQGLMNLIKACQSADRNIYALGIDLENDLGLPMNQEEPLRHGLISPWYDEEVNEPSKSSSNSNAGGGLLGLEGNFGAASGPFNINNNINNNNNNNNNDNSSNNSHHSTDLLRQSSALDSIIPACYHVPSLPAATSKISSFADETLFYIFYAMPGDRMQELSARELFSRGWRFHKPTKSWICPVASASETSSAFSSAQSSPASFYVFDQTTWIKLKRSMTLQADDLEFSRPVNSGTASPISSPEIMHGSGTLHSTSVTH